MRRIKRRRASPAGWRKPPETPGKPDVVPSSSGCRPADRAGQWLSTLRFHGKTCLPRLQWPSAALWSGLRTRGFCADVSRAPGDHSSLAQRRNNVSRARRKSPSGRPLAAVSRLSTLRREMGFMVEPIDRKGVCRGCTLISISLHSAPSKDNLLQSRCPSCRSFTATAPFSARMTTFPERKLATRAELASGLGAAAAKRRESSASRRAWRNSRLAAASVLRKCSGA